MRTLDIQNICLQTYRNNRIRSKVAYFLRKIQILRANNSRILRIQNAKFSGYYFYMDTNIWRDFQICINVPLIETFLVEAIPFSVSTFSLAEVIISYLDT